MKYLLLALIPLCSFAQEPPKKANVIIIQGVTFKEVANQLLDKGYEIDKIDSNLNTIKTMARESNKYPYGWTLTLNIRVKDSSAIIRGKGYMSVFGDFDVENRGMKNSVVKVSFQRTDDFAKSFNKPIEYLKEIKMQELLIGAGYFVICLLVSIEGNMRGYNLLWCLFISIMCSPIIGAIFFSQYKKD